MAIYENVKAKCKECGRTVTSIENELGFARGSIYKWDNSPPGILKVKAVAELLGVSIEELLA